MHLKEVTIFYLFITKMNIISLKNLMIRLLHDIYCYSIFIVSIFIVIYNSRKYLNIF